MQNLVADYEHDVFISYKRSLLIYNWVTKFFLPHFEGWLEEELLKLQKPASGEPEDVRPRDMSEYQQTIRIFFDKRSIEPGDDWPHELRRAVKSSKTLLAICSPTYFHSRWCRSEWQSFIDRQSEIGTYGLIIPVKYHDSEHYLAGISWSDFSEYTFQASDFYQSAQAVRFETLVKNLAEVVARAIHTAPPFSPDWPAPIVQRTNPTNPRMERM
jgi:hypothetical protein